jgi:hypothetical protein
MQLKSSLVSRWLYSLGAIVVIVWCLGAPRAFAQATRNPRQTPLHGHWQGPGVKWMNIGRSGVGSLEDSSGRYRVFWLGDGQRPIATATRWINFIQPDNPSAYNGWGGIFAATNEDLLAVRSWCLDSNPICVINESLTAADAPWKSLEPVHFNDGTYVYVVQSVTAPHGQKMVAEGDHFCSNYPNVANANYLWLSNKSLTKAVFAGETTVKADAKTTVVGSLVAPFYPASSPADVKKIGTKREEAGAGGLFAATTSDGGKSVTCHLDYCDENSRHVSVDFTAVKQ